MHLVAQGRKCIHFCLWLSPLSSSWSTGLFIVLILLSFLCFCSLSLKATAATPWPLSWTTVKPSWFPHAAARGTTKANKTMAALCLYSLGSSYDRSLDVCRANAFPNWAPWVLEGPPFLPLQLEQSDLYLFSILVSSLYSFSTMVHCLQPPEKNYDRLVNVHCNCSEQSQVKFQICDIALLVVSCWKYIGFLS